MDLSKHKDILQKIIREVALQFKGKLELRIQEIKTTHAKSGEEFYTEGLCIVEEVPTYFGLGKQRIRVFEVIEDIDPKTYKSKILIGGFGDDSLPIVTRYLRWHKLARAAGLV